MQLELAKRFDRPVVVHTRDADDDTAAMVREAGAEGIRGVLHCFTSGAALARTALDAGWYISFSGIVTFRNWGSPPPAWPGFEVWTQGRWEAKSSLTHGGCFDLASSRPLHQKCDISLSGSG